MQAAGGFALDSERERCKTSFLRAGRSWVMEPLGCHLLLTVLPPLTHSGSERYLKMMIRVC